MMTVCAAAFRATCGHSQFICITSDAWSSVLNKQNCQLYGR